MTVSDNDLREEVLIKFSTQRLLNELNRRGILTFYHLKNISSARKELWHGKEDKWVISDWTNAMAGEAGEACNIAKKIRRIDIGVNSKRVKEPRSMLVEMLVEELADTVMYADLTASFLDCSIEDHIKAKFNLVSIEEGFPQRL